MELLSMLYMQVEMALNYKTIRYVKEKDFPVELLRLAPNLRLFVTFCRIFLQWHLLFEWVDNFIFYCRGLCSLFFLSILQHKACLYMWFSLARAYLLTCCIHQHFSNFKLKAHDRTCKMNLSFERKGHPDRTWILQSICFHVPIILSHF